MACSLILSTTLWFLAHHYTELRLNERFGLQANDITNSVSTKVLSYQQLLLGAKGLLQNSPNPSRESWHRYLDTLSLDVAYPGATAVGYSARVTLSDKDRFIREAKQQTAASFTIWPIHKRDEFHTILVCEPMDAANTAVIGYDMMTEPTRRAAMKRARDTGLPAISGGVRPISDEMQAADKGFFLFVPVYNDALPLENPDDRRMALLGFVFCHFRIDTLLGDLAHNNSTSLDFEVFDLPEALPKHLLYSSHAKTPEDFTQSIARDVEILGRSWHLRFQTNDRFASHMERYGDWYLGGAFLVFNLLLFNSLNSLTKRRHKAELLALEMTRDMRFQMEVNSQLLQRFEKIAAHIPGILCQFRLKPDQSFSFPYSSQGIQEIYFMSPEEAAIDASPIFHLIHPADLQGFVDSIKVSGLSLQSWNHQFRIRYENGRERWLYGTASPEHESDGTTLWHGFITDISELKAAQEEAQKALTELSHQKFAMDQHAIVEITDVHGSITYVNDRSCELSGFAREDILGQSHRLVNSGHHTKEFWKDMFRTISAGKVWHGEVCNRARSGSVYWQETTLVPILRDDKKVDRYIAIRTDITQRKLLETSLSHARDQAFEASRLKSEFLASMSHEIRTPMNGIIGMGNLLLQSELPPRQQEMASVLKSSAESLMRIIDDILDFSKIEAGKLHIETQPFNLASLIADIARLLEPRAKDKKLAFNILTDPRLDTVLIGDAGRLRQILLNLAGNALKFTERGKVEISSNVLNDKGHSLVILLTINDTGIGISDDAQGLLFQPFVQADGTTTRRFGGTGLGLAISRHLVELMGGRIGFLSEQGRGSSFWIEIELPHQANTSVPTQNLPPINLSPPTPEPTRPSHSLGLDDTPIPGNKGLRLLLAEDNPANQLVAKYLLKDLGHSFDLAINGRQVLALLEKSTYDAILMDCQMPELDGYETTRLIRGGKAGINPDQIPIIALTAYAMQGDRDKCLVAGMSDYVTKPIDPKLLSAALERCGLISSSNKAEAPLLAPPPTLNPLFSKAQWDILEGLPAADGGTALDEVIKLFIQHTPVRLEEITQLLSSQDLKNIGRTAHTIAGSAASLGALPMQQAALALERAAKANQDAEIRPLHDHLIKAWSDTQDELRRLKKVEL